MKLMKGTFACQNHGCLMLLAGFVGGSAEAVLHDTGDETAANADSDDIKAC